MGGYVLVSLRVSLCWRIRGLRGLYCIACLFGFVRDGEWWAGGEMWNGMGWDGMGMGIMNIVCWSCVGARCSGGGVDYSDG